MVPSKLCARGGSIVGAYVGASPRPADTNIALGLLKLKAYGLIKLCWWFRVLRQLLPVSSTKMQLLGGLPTVPQKGGPFL